VLLNTAWMPLSAEKLVEDLFARPNWLATITQRWTPAQRALLHRPRGSQFTISDVPLLDEAAELLGEFQAGVDPDKLARKQQRKRDIENAERAIENMGVEGMVSAEQIAGGFAERAASMTTSERAAGDRTWAFGHVVVDEAQELSPMQWRLLSRRCPLRSFTVVGDIAQASSPAAASSWDRALQALLGRRRGSSVAGTTAPWRLEELTVNYRTPSQIVEHAERLAVENGLTITASRSVRSSEWPVREIAVPALAAAGDSRGGAAHDALVAAALEAVAADRGIDSEGTLAVIAPQHLVADLVSGLDPVFPGQVAPGTASLTRPISVLSPATSKGLEFDSVVLVDPEGIRTGAARGAASLYVAMTRPTQRLTVVG
jgi:hypothetical protein